MTDLISFDRNDGTYRDSGEGGLYAMLLVPRPDYWPDNCHVETHSYVMRPDVLIHPRGDEPLWNPWDQKEADVKRDLYIHLNDDDPNLGRAYMQMMNTSISYSELSDPLLASIHLGSTGESLYSNEHGHYWRAGYDDLTTPGRTLHNTLASAYGVKPIIATFLDT